MTKPICTKVTPASLPGLLKRLENETSVRWIDGTKLTALPNSERIRAKYVSFGASYGYMWWADSSRGIRIKTPNEFVRLVSLEWGKD